MTEVIYKIKSSIIRLKQYIPAISSVQQMFQQQSLDFSIDTVVDQILYTIGSYEKALQQLENNLRKHIKNQIQLKIYYEHLESVISDLKMEKESKNVAIEELKTEIQTLRSKQKHLLTLTGQNTKHNQQNSTKLDTKLDTLTKIKHRLSFNNTTQFLPMKKIEKEEETKDLHSKRQNLAKTLKQLYENPQIGSNESSFDKSRSKSRKRSSSNKSKGSKTKLHKDKTKTPSNTSKQKPKIGKLRTPGNSAGSSRKNSIF